jgi:hypothetical protein
MKSYTEARVAAAADALLPQEGDPKRWDAISTGDQSNQIRGRMPQGFPVGKRVGTLELRRSPDRLINRFGNVMEGNAPIHRPDDFVLVHWDDGEMNFAEKSELRSMSEMNDNPLGLPVVDFMAEIDYVRSVGVLLARRASVVEEFNSMGPMRKFAFMLSL